MIQKSRMKKKCFCLILVFLMVFSQLPAAVFAETAGEMSQGNTEQQIVESPFNETPAVTDDVTGPAVEAPGTVTEPAVELPGEEGTGPALSEITPGAVTEPVVEVPEVAKLDAAVTEAAVWSVQIRAQGNAVEQVSGLQLSFSYGEEYKENGFQESKPLEPVKVVERENIEQDTVYTLEVPSGKGVLYYSGTGLYGLDAPRRVSVGEGAVPITENGQVNVITRLWVAPDILFINTDILPSDVKVTVSDDAGWTYPGQYHEEKDYERDGGYTFVLPAYEDSRLFVFTTEVSEKYREKYGAESGTAFTVKPKGDQYIRIRVQEQTEVTFKITKGAELEFGRKLRHYIPLNLVKSLSVDKADPNFDSYTFKYPLGGVQPYMWRVKKEGFVTQARTMDQSIVEPATYTVELESMPDKPKRVEYSDASAEDSMLMNAPDSQYITLTQGQEFTIRPLRVWQIGNNPVDNFYIEPEYHYTVVAGDSVEITDQTNYYNISHGTVKAIKNGVSLVRVTYDPIQIGETYWNGTDPNQVGLIVFNVTDQDSRDLHANIDVREYDTVYINDGVTYPDGTTLPPLDTAPYTFTPDAGCSVRVLAPSEDPEFCTDWGFGEADRWTDCQEKNGSFTVQLKEGRNVVEVSRGDQVQYHVIRAVPLSVMIQNRTNPGKSPLAGDSIAISFKGISMPLPKLAAIYNPGYSASAEGTVRVEYFMNGDRVFSKGTQYDLPKHNTIIVDMDEAGEYDFKKGGIYLTWYGSSLDAHRHISDQGLLPNFNAPDHPRRSFSYLPQFSIKIRENEELAEQQKMNYARLQNAFRVDPVNYAPQGELPQNILMMAAGRSGPQTTLNIVGMQYKDVIYGSDAQDKPYEKGIPGDFNIYWRHWGANSRTSSVDTEKSTERITEFPVSELKVVLTSKNQGISKPDKPFANGELILVPKDAEKGYPKTYSFIFLAGDVAISRMTKLGDILLGFPGGKDVFSPTQGLLKANPVEAGELGTLDLGYGYLQTETYYTVSVPYETDQITLQPTALSSEHNYAYVKVSVNGKAAETLYSPARDKYPGKILPNYDDADGSENVVPRSKPVSLEPGETTIQLMVTNQGTDYEVEGSENETYNPTTYTIKVIRESAPSKVKFKIPDGTDLLVKKVSGTTMKADKDNKLAYSLPAGEYKYTVSGGGYMATTFSLTVEEGKDQTVTVKPEELTGVEKREGRVTVSVIGDSFLPVNGASVEIAAEPADLTAYVPPRAPEGTQPIACVKYNYGGYTALHAILEALSSGQNPIEFTCRNGNLVPHIGQDETGFGPNAGWRCMVNGVETAPATTLVKNGDRIDFYHDSDRDKTTHVWFDQRAYSADKSQKLTLTLMSAPIGNTNPALVVPCSGASVRLISKEEAPKEVGVTNEKGQITLDCGAIGAGSFVLMASLKDSGDKELLTYNRTNLVIEGEGGGGSQPKPETGKISVTFRLIGDSYHETPNRHEKYVTWIATKKMKLDEGSTVYDAFTQALDKAGLNYVGAESNYVSTITAPKAYGGYKLSEFSNGKNSGWMYTVNGQHPNVGLKYYTLKQGDRIIWHYIDDYKKEAGWDGDHTVPSYTWLEAEDVDPPIDKVIDMSGGSGTVQTVDNGMAVGSVSVAAKTDSSGKASASVSAKAMNEALKTALEAAKKAEKDGRKNVKPQIEISVTADSKATGVETALPADPVKEIVKNAGSMKLDTPVGVLTFNAAALSALADQASGSDITLTISKVDVAGTEVLAIIPALKDRPVYRLSALSGGKAVSDFKQGTVTLSLPYTLGSGERASEIRIAYVDDKGILSMVAGSSYDAKAKAATGETSHFSYYGIVNRSSSFIDVKSGAWYYDAVMYLANNGIVKGISDTAFGPDNSITRAEFVQILYNRNGAPAVSSASGFGDVKDGAWYAKAVIWASEQGIVSGSATKDKTVVFKPDDNISRQDMATILSSYLEKVEKKELKAANEKISFVDAAAIADYAKASVEKMQIGGILSGSGTKEGAYSFKPADKATRAEAASMLAKLFQTVRETK